MSVCENGHVNDEARKFCGECGQPLAPSLPGGGTLERSTGDGPLTSDSVGEFDRPELSLGVPTRHPGDEIGDRRLRNRIIAGVAAAVLVLAGVLIAVFANGSGSDDGASIGDPVECRTEVAAADQALMLYSDALKANWRSLLALNAGDSDGVTTNAVQRNELESLADRKRNEFNSGQSC